MSSEIEVDVTEDKATITLQREDKNNALNSEMYSELFEIFTGFNDNDSLSVVTIRGAGGHFSAGVDVSPVPEWGEAKPREIRDQYEIMHGVLQRIESLNIPVIAAIDGYCLGGALELAISCDICVVHEDSQLGLPEANMGFAMDQGGLQKLPGIIGEGMTKYLVMTGKLISGEHAHDIGLAQEVAKSDEEFEQRVTDLEENLASQPTYVMDMAKRQIHSVRPPNLDEEMERAIHHAILAYKEEETQQRVADFLDK